MSSGVWGGWFLGFALAVVACSPSLPSKGTRIVLITLDTLRQDVLAGSAGQPSGMPLLLARAESGARFTRFFAASSSTQPTHATLLTGLHPWEHGVTRNGLVLAKSLTTVTEQLVAEGYEAHAVIASYPVAAKFGFDQGFDSYREDFTTGFVGGVQRWAGHAMPSDRFYSRAETVTDRALAAIAGASGDRQFYWFHYFDPHAPYGSSSGGELLEVDVFRRVDQGEAESTVLEAVRELYWQDAAHLDRQLERLLARLDADAERFETHILLVSDHGESFGEGGSLGHGYRLSRSQIQVPAVLLSARVQPGTRSDVAGSVDVATTLLALAGLASETSAGRDLTRAGSRGAVALGMRRTFRGGRSGEWRLDGRVHPVPPLSFFLVDVRGRQWIGNGRRVRGPGEASAIRERFRGFERRLAEHSEPGALDSETEERLRALGYAP